MDPVDQSAVPIAFVIIVNLITIAVTFLVTRALYIKKSPPPISEEELKARRDSLSYRIFTDPKRKNH